VATVSARALIILNPILGSFAQYGISPQRIREPRRLGCSGCCRITDTFWVGAILNLGVQSSSGSMSKRSAKSSLLRERRYRPHMSRSIAEREFSGHGQESCAVPTTKHPPPQAVIALQFTPE